MKKYRILKKNNKWYVQYKSWKTFYRWVKIDYFFEEDKAIACFNEQLAFYDGQVIKESDWMAKPKF